MHLHKPRHLRALYLEVLDFMASDMGDGDVTVKQRLKTTENVVIIGVLTDSSDDHRVYAVYRNLKERSFHLFLKDHVSILSVDDTGIVTINNGQSEMMVGKIRIDELIGKYYVFQCYVASGWGFALKRVSGNQTNENAGYVDFVKTTMKKTIEWYNDEYLAEKEND